MDNDAETMYLYTEKETRLICEVKVFNGFALVRPVDPAYYMKMEKVGLIELSRRYDEYSGSYDDIRAYLAGMNTPVIMN